MARDVGCRHLVSDRAPWAAWAPWAEQNSVVTVKKQRMGARNSLRCSEGQLSQDWLSTDVAKSTAFTSPSKLRHVTDHQNTRVQPCPSSFSTDSYLNSRLDQLFLFQRPTTSPPLNPTTQWIPSHHAPQPRGSRKFLGLEMLTILAPRRKPCALFSMS